MLSFRCTVVYLLLLAMRGICDKSRTLRGARVQCAGQPGGGAFCTGPGAFAFLVRWFGKQQASLSRAMVAGWVNRRKRAPALRGLNKFMRLVFIFNLDILRLAHLSGPVAPARWEEGACGECEG